MIGYKVVSNVNGKLLPAVHYTLGPEYKLKEWVKPEIQGTQLMCWNSLDRARIFAGVSGGYIYKCEYVKTKQLPIFLRGGNAFTNYVEDFLNNILKLKKKRKKFSNLSQFNPEKDSEVVFCDKIKLLERVV